MTTSTSTTGKAVARRRRSRPPRTTTIRPETGDARFDVAAQAVARGNQDIRVLAVSACASGTGTGHVAVRVGRLLVYVEDRDALSSFVDAWTRAANLADNAFGPLWINSHSETAARIRRDGGTLTP